jgi:hypothetical protein
MPLGSALGLPVGAVLDLDRSADSPVDLYVNGVRFARGELFVTDDGEWAVSLDALESEGMRMLEQARSAPAVPQADVEADAQPVDPDSDQPIHNEDPEADADPQTDSADPQNAPNLQEQEVEGAVT